MKKTIGMLVAMGAGAVFGSTAPYGSVVGYWKFNDASDYGVDSSGFGHTLTAFQSGVAGAEGTGASSNGYDGSGYLAISTAGNTATGTFGDNWLDVTKGYTILVRYKNTGFKTTVAGETEVQKLLNTLNDKDSWHFAAYRYDPNLLVNKQYSETLYTDPTFGDRYGTGFAKAADGSYAEAVGSKGSYLFPVVVTSGGITIGGKVGANKSGYNVNFVGYIDEVIVISRVLSWQELVRVYQAGETFVYPVGTTLSFSNCGGGSGWSYRQWAATGHEQNYAPSVIPGADFIVDDERSVSADLASFPCRSLTLGRLSHLVSRVDGHQITTSQAGKLTQNVTNLEIADLRLQNGEYLAGSVGERLNATKLTVLASQDEPFKMNTGSGKVLTVTGNAVGGGWIRMTGGGTLDLWNLTGDYKVAMSSGTTKCRRVDSYSGSTIDVSDGEVTVMSTTNQYNGISKFVLKCVRTLTAVGEYPILTVWQTHIGTNYMLTGDSAISVASDDLLYGGVKVTLNGNGSRTLWLVCKPSKAPLPDEDKGAKPMLLWQ